MRENGARSDRIIACRDWLLRATPVMQVNMMTRHRVVFWVIVSLVIGGLHLSGLQAQSSTVRTVEEAYPGLGTHVLGSAKMINLGKGLLIKSEGIEIRESHLKVMVEKADPSIRTQLEKNLFFLLEQETMKRILVHEAQRMGIAMKSPEEESQAIQSYLGRVVQDVSVSDEEAKNFYEQNREMVGGMPFAQVKETIKQVLLQQKRADAVDAHIRDLVRKADIKISEKWVKDQYILAMDNPVDKARRTGKPTMVEFGATGCVPCDMMQPILDNLRKKFPDKLNVVFVHVGENRILGARFGIRAIPVQVFYDRNGGEAFRHVGFYAEKEVLKQLAKLGVE